MKIIKDILPFKTNQTILKLLVNQKWGFAYDNNHNGDIINNLFNKNKHMGFFCKTLEDNKPIIDTPLNFFAKTILDIVTSKLNITEEVFIHRFYWNMYYPFCTTEFHDDGTRDDAFSIVYNIHTTDGGLEMNNTFYPDKMGEAKIFQSKILHKGVVNKTSAVRFNLNIVFYYNDTKNLLKG